MGERKQEKTPKNKQKKTDGNDNGVMMMRVYANVPSSVLIEKRGIGYRNRNVVKTGSSRLVYICIYASSESESERRCKLSKQSNETWRMDGFWKDGARRGKEKRSAVDHIT